MSISYDKMYDVECPYCGEGLDINHDDGQGYEEDKDHEMQCKHCEKYFVFTTSIHYYYDAKKADCLNGAEHNWEPIKEHPNFYVDPKRCKDCGFENYGERDEEKVAAYFKEMKVGEGE